MGILYIVSTPIGNLGDITLRALETLKAVDYVLCEDTRVTGKLLSHYDISKRMVSFNDFNEESKIGSVLSDLENGSTIALVSDAGTPLVSDPGYKLIREAIARSIKVDVVPGPSAIVASLVVSGKPPDKFLFLGYLPKKAGKRKEVLDRIRPFRHPELVSGSRDSIGPSGLQNDNLKEIMATIIFYESPYRVLDTLRDILEVLGDVDIVVARELTKIHEEVRREKVSEAIEYFRKNAPKGEFVLLI